MRDELALMEVGFGDALYDVIGVPINAFSIDDEKIGSLDKILKFALMKYSSLPIQELDNKSLKDLGIEIEFCKRISNADLNRKLSEYFQSNNFEYVEEKVMWKNMTDDEKSDVFSRELKSIETENNELIIVDPYLFSSDDMEYCNLLANIIKKSKAKSVIVITDERHYKDSSLDAVKNEISIPIEVKFSADFHDRFWISNRKKGFCTGTSLNGVGKRISLINVIENDDVTDIVEELTVQSLI